MSLCSTFSLLFLLAGSGVQSGPKLETIDALARAKDYRSLARYSVSDGSEFRVLKGGAYDVGSLGWKAIATGFAGKEFVLLTTPLTSQDTGELLFYRSADKLAYIDELEKDGLRITYQDLKVGFEFPKKKVRIEDELTVKVTGSAPHGVHTLRFSPCYQVRSLVDGEGRAVEYKQLGGIVFLKQLPIGVHKLKLNYEGIVNLPNYAGSIVDENATLTNDYWYPMSNRMPCAYRIQVEAPKGYTVVAQGKQQEVTATKDGISATYKMDLPVTYWSLTVAKLINYSEQRSGIKLQMWSPRVPLEKMKLQPALYETILQHYQTFAPFPFDSYGGLDSPTYGGGALEAYSFATYGGWLPAEDAHEPAHTWWGGLINNTYLRSFWNESFAVWCERYYLQDVNLGNRQERQLAHLTSGVPSADDNEAPLMMSGAKVGPVASSLGYGKGAYVLEMLEQLVGTENLVECMREWQRVHPKGEPGEWEDFERVVLRKLPTYQLKSFFDDWFRRPGYANVSLPSAKMVGGELLGRLSWTGPRFRMPLELWLEDARGQLRRMTLDTKDCAEDGSFKIRVLGFAPVRVYFDPYHRALRSGDQPDYRDFAQVTSRFRVYRDPKQPGMAKGIEKPTVAELSASLENTLIIGHPSTTPQLVGLLAKAGARVVDDLLTFEGTSFNLKESAFFATVTAPSGKPCAIIVGNTDMPLNSGHAYAGVVDRLGRLLRAKTNFPGRREQALELR